MNDADYDLSVVLMKEIEHGHKDPANLRKLLIRTTSTNTAPLVEAYFSHHLNDPALLSALVAVALEGEDAGDAPWAAANTITLFPAELLREHEKALASLSQENWAYLSDPAKIALAKINTV